MTWKIFLQSLLTAAVSGAAGALATSVAGGNTRAVGATAAAGALIGVANHLRESPTA